MEEKIFLVEDFDCEYRAFRNFHDALVYAVEQIEKSNNSNEVKLEMYKELVLSVADRNVNTWGLGYSIDEFLWCWEINLYDSKGE